MLELVIGKGSTSEEGEPVKGTTMLDVTPGGGEDGDEVDPQDVNMMKPLRMVTIQDMKE